MNNSMITCKFVGPTNSRGSRIRLKTWDLSHYNNKKPVSKFINYDYSGDTYEVTKRYFKKMGLKTIGMNDRGDEIIYLFDWDIDTIAAIFGYQDKVTK